MRTRRQLTTFVILAAVLILTAFSRLDVPGIENLTTSGFLIHITGTGDGLKLTCKKGCAWKELSFSLEKDKFQTINQHGMISTNSAAPSISSFVLNIQRTKTGINLEGKEGTSWKRIKFSCKQNMCSHYVDQNGMTTGK
jgi:hypothetical protein